MISKPIEFARPEMASAQEAPAAKVGRSAPAHPLLSMAARFSGLAPDRLAATTQAAARALLRQGEATNTRLSYSSAMRYWCAWFAARYGQALTLPVPVPVVVQFIVDHAARRPEGELASAAWQRAGELPEEGGREEGAPAEQERRTGSRSARPIARRAAASDLVTELPADVDAALVAGGYKGKPGPPALNTLVHRIAVLSKAHQMAHAGRTSDGGFAQALVSPAAGRRRGEPRGEAEDSALANEAGSSEGRIVNPCADPLVRELLARTRRAYAQRGVRPQKQRALTKDPMQQLLATCDASMKGIRDRALLLFAWSTGGRRRSEVTSAQLADLHRVNAESFVYTLGHSKTNQRGEQRPEDVKPLTGSAAQAMQAWLDVLKSQGVKDGAIFRRIRRGGHVGEPMAASAVRDIVKDRCALAGIEGKFSAHSLRAGFVTEAGRQAMPMAETMALTGHQSVASVVGYFRPEGTASRLRSLLDE